jgi:hypothetical protein
MPLINYIGNRQECLDNNKRVRRGDAPAPIFLDYLVVGGGGYGTSVAGGGGGVVSGSIRFLPRFTLDVTVGNGGTGSTQGGAEASIIDTISPQGEFFEYAGSGSIGTSGYPNLFPAGLSTSQYSQPGAGGSAQSGSAPASDSIGGAGGSGSSWAFDNGLYMYGGGGGGLGTFFLPNTGTGGVGGQGGGGNGKSYNAFAGNGTINTGGGGGGTDSTATNGGSGIVKMRYISGSVMGVTGGTISISGSFVYHTFTGSGQFVYQP